MILKNISIVNYKNIRAARLSFSPKVNCLVGRNGMGKTNLLDAIYYLSFCHSSFSNVDSLSITHGEDFFVVEGDYLSDTGDSLNIYAGMKRGRHKHFRRDHKDYKKLSMHIGLLPLIFVTPSDNILVSGSGEERRKLMDVVVSQYDRTYMDALARYNKALQQRNVLLKMEQEPDATLMDLWEEQMAEAGEEVFHKREAFVQELVPVFQRVYGILSDGAEPVSLRYVSHAQRGPLIDVIRRDRMRDRAVGYSLHGIHRDDLEMLIDGYPMRREGSQGQTKTYVLALKLAQFDFLRRTESGTVPMLLLDDIFDKLDSDRVEKIVELVSGDTYGQIFITDTNREHLDRMLDNVGNDYKIFEVRNGEVAERNNQEEE